MLMGEQAQRLIRFVVEVPGDTVESPPDFLLPIPVLPPKLQNAMPEQGHSVFQWRYSYRLAILLPPLLAHKFPSKLGI